MLHTALTPSGLPIGTIVAAALVPTSLPADWLPCDGSAIPTQYQQLVTILGSKTTPNLIGRTLIGQGVITNASNNQTDGRAPLFEQMGLGSLPVNTTGGEAAHMLASSEIPEHSHTILGGNFGYHHRSFEGEGGSDSPFETQADNPVGGTDSFGGSGPHYNVQPYYVVTYMIYAGTPSLAK